jgi:hypothetical protein
MGVLLYYHIQWWTKPFRYPQFSTRDGASEEVILFVVGNFVLVGVAALLVVLFKRTGDLLISILNLNSTETKWSRKIVTKFFGGLLLAAIFIGILALPLIG